MDLISLVLTLRPEREAELPPRLGRAAHAIFLERLAQRDAAQAQALHDAQGPKPFTCSDLMGTRRHRRVSPEECYTLRYTALTAPLSEVLGELFAPGDRLDFEGVPCVVETLEDGAGDSPWAGRATYHELAAQHLTGSTAPRRKWSFVLAAPTAFQSQGRTRPLPLPGLLFGSLVRQWNAFATVALPAADVVRYAEEMVVVSRFSLRSAPGWERGRALRIGAIGKVTYHALNRDRYWLSVLGLLGAFARYAGVGSMTTMGMGQVRQEV